MKKFLVAMLALVFFALPVTAEAQQKKKKKQQDEDNPIVLLLGIFSTINCIITCGSTTLATTTFLTNTATVTTTTFTTVTTTTFVQELERFVTTTQQVPVTNTTTVTTTTPQTSYAKRFFNGYVAGAAICTVAWPFINVALGLPEPTPEEALLNSVSCWVPGLGILLYLQQQQGT